MAMESLLYQTNKDNLVTCQTCHHYCRIPPGKRGICRVRENQDGRLVFLAFDRVIAASVDPIEKKPIYHLKPGSRSYSIATPGCNLKCQFCQNADIAQMPQNNDGLIKGMPVSPNTIVVQALEKGCKSISYTYTEPTIFFELAYETAKLAKKNDLLNVFVTNGYMSPEALGMLSGILDAANVDLKSFDPGFYSTYCGATLKPVLQNLKQMKKMGILLEITTLLIPGLNDDADQLSAMADFISTDLGPETPWHISRFHPSYQMMDRAVTPVSALEAAYEIGKNAGLHYVYVGNLPGHDSEHTRCQKCHAVVIHRHGYQVDVNMLESDNDPAARCPECSTPVYGIF
jgi:pyruvate formate lyase activating enzyme